MTNVGNAPPVDIDMERRVVFSSDTERVLSRLHSEVHDLIPEEPKRGPFATALWWWMSWAVPGLGMFTEAYFLFAIGNIEPLLAIIYPSCWGDDQPADCNTNVVKNVSTIEICGIVAGMLIISFFADWIGRKKGSRMCTSIMAVGGILLTAADGSAAAYLTLLCVGLSIFGFGVGGEYPIAASSAAERAEGSAENRAKRGQTIALVFTQQGWGNFSNTLVILILLACFGATGRQPTADESSTILHVQFAVGLAIILGLLVYRFTKLEESKVWEAERRGVDQELKDEGEEGRGTKLYSVVLRRNWTRLFETCFAWFLNDFVFYGNKLFQSRFIAIMSGPDAPLFTTISWTLLNSAIGLVGYFTSAFMIDRRWYGRFWIQANGFLMLAVIFWSVPSGLTGWSAISSACSNSCTSSVRFGDSLVPTQRPMWCPARSSRRTSVPSSTVSARRWASWAPSPRRRSFRRSPSPRSSTCQVDAVSSESSLRGCCYQTPPVSISESSTV